METGSHVEYQAHVVMGMRRLLCIGLYYPGGSRGKESACQCRTREMPVWSLSQEDPLEKEMTTHSSILAWKVPWTEEPTGLLLSCRESDITERQSTHSIHTVQLEQYRLILDSVKDFFLGGAGSLWSVRQLCYGLKLQGKWWVMGRGPIHPPEFTLANYPARMEKCHGAEGQRAFSYYFCCNLWAPEGIPEEFGHSGRLNCLFEPHPCNWSLQLACCESQMKQKWREIFVNDFLGRVLETLIVGNREQIEASLQQASANPLP